MSLTSLPAELQLNVISQLPVFESQMLRMTNKHFYSLIAPSTPSHDELLVAQDTGLRDRNLIYCGSCKHLRKASDPKMRVRSPDSRFCIPCGSKPLEACENECEEEQYFLATFRYQDGEHWTVDGVEFTKEWCLRCGDCKAMLVEPHPDELAEEYEERICGECLPFFQPGGQDEFTDRTRIIGRGAWVRNEGEKPTVVEWANAHLDEL